MIPRILEAVSRACSSSLAGWSRRGGVILPVGAGVANSTSTAEGMVQIIACLTSEKGTRGINERKWQATEQGA